MQPHGQPVIPIPDFFIVGVQKAGTTALCSLIAQHPGVAFSRPKEPMVLSRDDAEVHPHYFANHPNEWQALDWESNRDGFLQPYASCFSQAQAGQLKGEGSTSYFIAPDVPKRIMEVNPSAKIIILLRDPVARAYSAYWHYVRSGIEIHGFENHLRYGLGMTLRQGHYAEYLAGWKTHIPHAQLLVLNYEDFRAQPLDVFQQVLAFLDLTPWQGALPAMERNEARQPRNLRLQLAANLLRRWTGLSASAMQDAPKGNYEWLRPWLKKFDDWSLQSRTYPPMDKALAERLANYYRLKNKDIK